MSERTKSNIPFVGLHAHSVAGSLFDALGYPPDHMDFAWENGCDALALTDHGNANGLSHQVLHAKKMKEQGKTFKPIFGCEAYFIPSIAEWRDEYEKALEDKKRAKSLGSELSGATVEDESSSKKVQDVLRRRRHLILLAPGLEPRDNLAPRELGRPPDALHHVVARVGVGRVHLLERRHVRRAETRLDVPLVRGRALGYVLGARRIAKVRSLRVVLAFVVAIDVADASSLAAIEVGSFSEPHRRHLLGLGRVPLGEFGHAVRVGLDPREHVVAPELELLRDVRDGHLPSATRERALENLDLRGGELGREGLQVGKHLLPIVVGRARRDGAAFGRLGPATRRRRRIPERHPGPAEPRGTGCASDERRAGPGRTRGRGARDDERGYLLSERDHRGLTGRGVE